MKTLNLFNYNISDYTKELNLSVEENRVAQFLEINCPLIMSCRQLLSTWEKEWEMFVNSPKGMIIREADALRTKEFIALTLKIPASSILKKSDVIICLKDYLGRKSAFAYLDHSDLYIFKDFINLHKDFIEITINNKP
jgi:hypothetical protein